MRQILSSILVSLTLLLTLGCGGEADQAPSNLAATTAVIGVVSNPAGSPLSGVTISSGSYQTTTDDKGNYILLLEADENTSVTAHMRNHTQNSRVVSVRSLQVSTLNFILAPVDALQRFDATVATTITTKGASVDLPANGFINEDGSSYTGEVTARVSYNRVTTPLGEALFPGDFIGLEDNGSTTGILSYGFIEVTLEDAQGNPLNLATGASASLTYPADANINTHPATIPLWYYDTARGIWVEDGFATYDALTNSYSGSVTHFTTWNLDAKFDGASVKGCVEDASGIRLTVADLYISTAGWNKHVRNVDENGAFNFINAPSNKTMSIVAKISDKSSDVETFTLTPGQSMQFKDCLVLDVNSSNLFSQIKGKILLSDGSAYANKYVNIYNANNSYISNFRTDENGSFISREFLRESDPTLTLSFSLYLGNNYSTIKKSFPVSTTQKLSDLGDIVLTLTHVNGCFQREDGNTSFIDSSNQFSVDIPYASYNYTFDQNGLFDFYIEQDFSEHTIYSYIRDGYLGAPSRIARYQNDYTLLGSTTFSADTSTIDLSSSCIVVSAPVDINKTVSVSMTSMRADAYLEIVYQDSANYEYPDKYGEDIFDGEEGLLRSTTFHADKNGIYYIFHSSTDYNNEDYDGTISVTIDGVTQTITIPENAIAYDGWIGFAIEVFQGEIKVIELNKEAGCQC